jgi:hypothetical protein
VSGPIITGAAAVLVSFCAVTARSQSLVYQGTQCHVAYLA